MGCLLVVQDEGVWSAFVFQFIFSWARCAWIVQVPAELPLKLILFTQRNFECLRGTSSFQVFA